MTKKKIALSALSLALASLFSGAASADYICSTNWKHYGGSSSGSGGFIQMSVYSGPGCTGSFVGTKYLCSTGATNVGCAASFLRTELQIMTEAPMLRAAADTDQRVGFTTSTCVGGGSGCPVSIVYHSN
jgi:hypothetical protein